MALSREDKADVKGAMGKAIANKVSKVTRDHSPTLKSVLSGKYDRFNRKGSTPAEEGQRPYHPDKKVRERKVTHDSKAPKFAAGYPKAGGDPEHLLKSKWYQKAQAKIIKESNDSYKSTAKYKKLEAKSPIMRTSSELEYIEGRGKGGRSLPSSKSKALKARASESNGTPKLRANTEKLRSEGKLYKGNGMAPDSPFKNVTHVGKKSVR